MYIDWKAFRYRGLSMAELDERIDFYEMYKGRAVDVERLLKGTVLLTKPGMSTQELAGQMLEIISETRTTALQAMCSRELGAYDVQIHLASGLNELETLCTKQLTESENSDGRETK
jgi:hypothetical protein